MRFSVIVPVYNVENFLPECVESILNQEYSDFELILVDDGATDNCPQICDQYAERDNRVKVIHKENGGLSDARNTGITTATGDYLLFIDSDDYWNSSFVLKKINDIVENNKVDIVQFGQQKYYHLEKRLAPGPQRMLSKYNGCSTNELISQLISSEKLTISACSMALSREFIINNNLYFEKGLKTEDLEWAIRLYVANPKWSFIDEYFYVYRMQRKGSISTMVDYKHLCDYCWIIENSLKLIENKEDSIKIPLISYLMYHVLIASAYVYKAKLERKQKKEILSRLKAVSTGKITKYTMNKKVKLASVVYRIGGFYIMSSVLGFYLNNRGR